MAVLKNESSGPCQAFTLVELLVVIGIIAILMSLLLPSLSAARRSAKTVQCASNIRQICAAMLAYASQNNGKFPPNSVSTYDAYSQKQGCYWFDPDRTGDYLSAKLNITKMAGSGALVCPEDATSWRSYSMNQWASSIVESTPLTVRTVWTVANGDSSRLILVTESWTSAGSVAAGFSSPPTVGIRSNSAGQLFGAGGGTVPFSAGPWGKVNCELAYSRHRVGAGIGTQPIGKVNIGYADGHVEPRSNSDLADTASGYSRLDALWSPLDYQYP